MVVQRRDGPRRLRELDDDDDDDDVPPPGASVEPCVCVCVCVCVLSVACAAGRVVHVGRPVCKRQLPVLLGTMSMSRRIRRQEPTMRSVYDELGSREWLACWTQAQKGPGSNRSRDVVG